MNAGPSRRSEARSGELRSVGGESVVFFYASFLLVAASAISRGDFHTDFLPVCSKSAFDSADGARVSREAQEFVRVRYIERPFDSLRASWCDD